MSENTISIVDFLYNQNIPFAVYRFPETDKLNLIIQHDGEPLAFDKLCEIENVSGFVVSRFPGVNDKGGGFLLKPDLVVELTSSTTLADLNLPVVHKDFSTNDLNLHTTKKEEYVSNVTDAVNSIQKGDFHKVVVSRVQVEKIKPDFSVGKVFQKLCENYPHAMVYLFKMPQTNAWMGATPEPCLLEKNGWFKTVSLAGTRVLGQKSLHDIQWGEKEIAEQAIVSRFIVKLIDNLGVDSYKIKGPQNFIAGNLVHLFTSFEFKVDDVKIKWTDFLESLHPTPSICGLPRAESLKFILDRESHCRSFYSGLIGPVNVYNSTDLFVNLRCMQIGKDCLALYSGAGITDSSDPQKEWEETTNKLQTVKKVLDA